MHGLRDTIKLIIKLLLRFVLKIYWIIPIKEKTIFFMANMGKGFLCNPKYIYNSMINDQRFSDYHFVWCFISPEEQPKALFSNNTILIKKSKWFQYFYYLLTSQIVIYNCGGFSYAPIRKKQFLIETGHGGGLQKRNGFMVESKSSASNKGIALADRDIKLWLASDEMHAKIYIRKAMNYQGEILESGYPRSDLFFSESADKKREILQKLGLKSDIHVVLYAPTFKGDEHNASSISSGAEIIDVDKVKQALSHRFGGRWLFAIRGHQYAQNVSINGYDMDLTKYDDMQELLLISDVLITDYSSCVWDFFLLGKPTFLYVPDRKYYEEEDRGFYIPLENWPGIIVSDNTQWEKIINKFDAHLYQEKLNKYGEMMHSYERGTACEAVKTRILHQVDGLLHS